MSTLIYVSEEVANFLGVEKNKQMTIFSVSIIIRDYIIKNKLQDKKKTYKINPNDKLSKLLNLKETDELTYFNLSKYVTRILLFEKPKKKLNKTNKINLEFDSSDDENSSYAKIHPYEGLII